MKASPRDPRLPVTAALAEAWIWLTLLLFIAIRVVGSSVGRKVLTALVGR